MKNEGSEQTKTQVISQFGIWQRHGIWDSRRSAGRPDDHYHHDQLDETEGSFAPRVRSTLVGDLAVMRKAIDLYAVEHIGDFPTSAGGFA